MSSYQAKEFCEVGRYPDVEDRPPRGAAEAFEWGSRANSLVSLASHAPIVRNRGSGHIGVVQVP